MGATPTPLPRESVASSSLQKTPVILITLKILEELAEMNRRRIPIIFSSTEHVKWCPWQRTREAPVLSGLHPGHLGPVGESTYNAWKPASPAVRRNMTASTNHDTDPRRRNGIGRALRSVYKRRLDAWHMESNDSVDVLVEALWWGTDLEGSSANTALKIHGVIERDGYKCKEKMKR
jgi:hypothetical protein